MVNISVFVKKIVWPIVIAFMMVAVSGCQTAGHHTRTGGLMGGMAGSAIGAIAGASQGKPLEGAAIGAIAGGTLGSVVGHEIDRDMAHHEAVYNAAFHEATRGAVSFDQAIYLARSGLGDDLIINQIQANGVVARPTTQDLIMLKQNGVSDRVIGAMQVAPVAGAIRPRGVVREPRPVIVEEHIWVDPWYRPWGPPAYYRRPRPGPSYGFHLSF